MSLIIAANLADRIYMCADTRLSRVLETGDGSTFEALHDNQLKTVNFKKSMVAGCVGSPALGAFIHAKITGLIGDDVYVRELYSLLKNKEAEIKTWVHEYLVAPPETSYKYGKCVLLFAGQNPNVKRTLPGKKLFDLVKDYGEKSQHEIDNLFLDKKHPAELTQEELQRLFEISTQRQMNLKEVIFQAITKSNEAREFLELDAPDQFIFALKINATGEEIVSFEEYEWGDIAVFGAGYTAEILPPTFFGDLDLRRQSGNLRVDIVEFLDIIRSKFSTTIGGTITNNVLINGSTVVVTDEVHTLDQTTREQKLLYYTDMIGGKLHHNQKGIWVRLIPFTETQKLPVNTALLVE